MKVFRSLFLLMGLTVVAACSAAPEPAAPAPAVVPPPAPVIAPAGPATPPKLIQHSFTVYFDTNKADIRASAMQILYGAAQVAKSARPVTIKVHGFTDAAGKASYNQRLSERRAAAVADQLRKLGLTVTIETRGFGESANGAKTKAKSKEGRRVEVVFEAPEPRVAAPSAEPAQVAAASVSMEANVPDRIDVTLPAPTAKSAPVRDVRLKGELADDGAWHATASQPNSRGPPSPNVALAC